MKHFMLVLAAVIVLSHGAYADTSPRTAKRIAVLEQAVKDLKKEQAKTSERLLRLLRAVEICRRHESDSSCFNRLRQGRGD